MDRPDARIRLLWIARAVFAGLALSLVGLAVDRFLTPVGVPAIGAAAGVLAILGVGHALLYYRSWRFEIQDDALYLVRGVLTEVETAVPYVRVQHVDTRRGPFERLVGLSSLVVYTAGTRGADIEIPGLTPARARALRDRLRDLAIASEGVDAV